jgi:DNA-binding XRE family transcriptional regulator
LKLPVGCRFWSVYRGTVEALGGRSSTRNRSPILAKVAGEHIRLAAVRFGGDEVPNNKLQRYREALMMSKAELARKSGLSTLTIDRVEAGRPCRLDTKRKILHALQLGVTEQDRVFGGQPMETQNATQGGASERS